MKIDYSRMHQRMIYPLKIPYFLNTVRVGWPSPADDYIERPID